LGLYAIKNIGTSKTIVWVLQDFSTS